MAAEVAYIPALSTVVVMPISTVATTEKQDAGRSGAAMSFVLLILGPRHWPYIACGNTHAEVYNVVCSMIPNAQSDVKERQASSSWSLPFTPKSQICIGNTDSPP